MNRILKEISDFKKDKTIKNAYIFPHENNMRNVDVLIIGCPNTPYECGYFWFNFIYPTDYPTNPIKVKFMTTDSGKIRFNPNLYVDGKVCLSLINTWGNNDWTPANTITTVILSIQSQVLNEEPIKNEPCYYDTKDLTLIRDHACCIRYHTLYMAIKFVNDKTGAPHEMVKIARKHFDIDKMRDICLKENLMKADMKNVKQAGTFVDFESIFNELDNITSFNNVKEENNVKEDNNVKKDNNVKEEEDDDNYKCDICLLIKEDVKKDKCCTFKSCKDCMNNWLKKSKLCPLCKKNKYKKETTNVVIDKYKNILYSYKKHAIKDTVQPNSTYYADVVKILDKLYKKEMTKEEAYKYFNKNLYLLTNDGKIYNFKTNRMVNIDGVIGKSLIYDEHLGLY